MTPWLQHNRFLCHPLSPRVCSNPCPLNWQCYLTISSSATPFSCCLQPFPPSGSFPMSWLFASVDQSTGVSPHQNHICTILPLYLCGSVSQSYLRCCLPGCNSHFYPNLTPNSHIVHFFQVINTILNLCQRYWEQAF